LTPQIKPGAHAQPAAEEDDVYRPQKAAVNALPAAPAATVSAVAPPVPIAAIHAQAAADPAASSAPASLADFTGRYLGAGVEVALAPSPQEPPRRMSRVEIAGDEREFVMRWATVKLGPNFKPEPVKATEQELRFRPGSKPGHFVAVAGADGLAAPDATAEISGRTMVVIKTETLPDGRRSIQRYERTLTGSGMDVVFTRTEGGQLVRQVNLKLTRGPANFW
jgi:hypothetical protein